MPDKLTITNRITELIKFQLPDFIRESHENFITFLEAYYEFLETHNKDNMGPGFAAANLLNFADVDKTLNEFLYFFSKEFLVHIPQQILCDRRKLLKNIKEFYRSRGCEKSYRLLFRILFLDKLGFYYPTVDLLRPDSGKWVLKKSIRCIRKKETSPFDVEVEFLNQRVIGFNSKASGIVDYVIEYDTASQKVYELFFKKNSINGEFQPWEPISVHDTSNLEKRLQIQPILTKVNIESPGEGYTSNSKVLITNPFNSPMSVYIREIDIFGGIVDIAVFDPGFGYPIYPVDDLNRPVISFPEHTDELAVAIPVIGALIEYPGYYVTTDGFLDSIEHLRDDYYWQEFSYAIKSHTNMIEWHDIINRILHPAGTIVFNHLLIEPEALFIGPKLTIDGGIELTIKNQSENAIDLFQGLPIEQIIQVFNGTGSQVLFTLDSKVAPLFAIPPGKKQILVYIDDELVTNYSILNGNQIVFDIPPVSGTEITVWYFELDNPSEVKVIVEDTENNDKTVLGSTISSIDRDAYQNVPTQFFPSSDVDWPEDYLLNYSNYSLDDLAEIKLDDLYSGIDKTLIQPRVTITTTHNISGTILYSGAPVQGIDVFLTGPINTQTYTNTNGEFIFTGLPPGIYDVTPIDAAWDFIPPVITLDVEIENVADFEATPNVMSYTISGYITGSPGIGNVFVLFEFDDLDYKWTFTDSSGYYEMTGLNKIMGVKITFLDPHDRFDFSLTEVNLLLDGNDVVVDPIHGELDELLIYTVVEEDPFQPDLFYTRFISYNYRTNKHTFMGGLPVNPSIEVWPTVLEGAFSNPTVTKKNQISYVCQKGNHPQNYDIHDVSIDLYTMQFGFGSSTNKAYHSLTVEDKSWTSEYGFDSQWAIIEEDNVLAPIPYDSSGYSVALPSAPVSLETGKRWAKMIYAGENLWLLPANENKIYYIAIDDIWPSFTPTINSIDIPIGFSVPDAAFNDMVFDGIHIWCSPHKADYVLKINIDTQVMSQVTNLDIQAYTDVCSGIAYDPENDNVWLIPNQLRWWSKINASTDIISRGPENLEYLTSYKWMQGSCQIIPGALWIGPGENLDSYQFRRMDLQTETVETFTVLNSGIGFDFGQPAIVTGSAFVDKNPVMEQSFEYIRGTYLDSFPIWNGSTASNFRKISRTINQHVDDFIADEVHSVSTFGTVAAGGSKWYGGVLADNGKIYGIPYSSSSVLKIDPDSDSVSTFGNTGSTFVQYFGGVLAENGMIYCVPHAATNVLKINPYTDTISTFGSLSGFYKWSGGVLAQNGMIYCLPNNSTSILKINPFTDTASLFGNVSTLPTSIGGGTRFYGGVLAPNGMIYGIPRDARAILKINPFDDTVSWFGTLSTANNKWRGGTISPDGKIYMVGLQNRGVLKLDPLTDSISYLTIPTLGNVDRAILGLNGKIYCSPSDGTSMLVIDTTDDSMTRLDPYPLSASDQYYGSVLSPNGELYLIPAAATTVKKIKINNLAYSSDYCLSRYYNKL